MSLVAILLISVSRSKQVRKKFSKAVGVRAQRLKTTELYEVSWLEPFCDLIQEKCSICNNVGVSRDETT